MDVTAMLNTASTAAVERKLQMMHERKDNSGDELSDAMQTPSATTGGSTAPSSTVATPLEKTPSRRSSDSRTPNRNRTPWDAGGYSLSLALDNTKKLVQTSPRTRTAFIVGGTSPIPRDVLPASAATPTSSSASTAQCLVHPESGSMDLVGGNTSPRHKFSDSRSSFSSAYTNASSTNNSVAHSRISSLSTVSENQPLATLITDFSLLETRISEPCIGLGHAHHASNSHQHQLKLQQYSFNTQVSPSRDDNPDLNCQPESPTPVRPRHDMSMGASPGHSPRSPGRAQSPSDAMLIQRPGQPGEAEESGYFPNPSRLQILSSHHQSQTRGDLLNANASPTRRHKRAVSAPDFASIGASSFNPRFPTFGPIPEPTPSPSQHSDGNGMEHDSASSSPTGPEQAAISHGSHAVSSDPQQQSSLGHKMAGTLSSSPQNMSPPGLAPSGHHSQTSVDLASDQSPSSQPTAAPGVDLPVNFDVASACMYRGDCQTGSQLRKAISHIFGRNKLCTRMIPTGVWVHYCRKHYQRTRYRNGGEYPQRQIGLVQVQVRRVQAWSDSNAQKNVGPVLKDWSLSVRKREQLRLENKMATGKKRPFHEDGMEEEEDNFDDERAELSGTAVPDWVVAQIGDGYSTPEILSIVDRLKTDIDQGRLQQIPDIEILPNIVTDSNLDAPAPTATVKKPYVKRRPPGSSSVGVNFIHRRTQSVNTSAFRYDSAPMARRSSQPNNYMGPSARPFAAEYNQLPMEKRQRVDGESIAMDHRHQHHHSVGGALDLYDPTMAATAPRPGFSGRAQLPHRPAFAGIRESHAEGKSGYYPEEQRYASDIYAHQTGYEADRRYSAAQMPAPGFDPRQHERHPSTSSSGPGETGYGVLPAPNPQRFGGPSVAQQLESSSYVLNSAATRRAGVHQRSQSEAGFLHHMPASSQYGRPTSSDNHAQPQLNNLPRLSTNFSEEDSRAAGYPVYQQQPVGHSSHPTPHYAPGHGHSHSMSYTHQYSRSGNVQDLNGIYYNQYTGPSRYAENERRGRLASQQAQPATVGPAVVVSSNDAFDKFENVQLPPLQNVVPFAPMPPQSTVSRAPALDSGAAAQPIAAESADRLMQSAASDYAGHAGHQSSPSATRVLGPLMEASNTSPYAAPPAQPKDAF